MAIWVMFGELLWDCICGNWRNVGRFMDCWPVLLAVWSGCEYGMSTQVGGWNKDSHIPLFLKPLYVWKIYFVFLILQDITRQYSVFSIRGDFGYYNSIGAVKDCEDHEVRLKAIFIYSLYYFLIQYTLATSQICLLFLVLNFLTASDPLSLSSSSKRTGLPGMSAEHLDKIQCD